jgi:hypothetical protein
MLPCVSDDGHGTGDQQPSQVAIAYAESGSLSKIAADSGIVIRGQKPATEIGEGMTT